MPGSNIWRSKKDPPRLSDTGQRNTHNHLLQAGKPSINLFAGLIFGVTVPLLQTTLQLVALAVDRSEIIVSEFSPLLLHLAFYLFPISFNSVPVHEHNPPVRPRWLTQVGGPRSADFPVSEGPPMGAVRALKFCRQPLSIIPRAPAPTRGQIEALVAHESYCGTQRTCRPFRLVSASGGRPGMAKVNRHFR